MASNTEQTREQKLEAAFAQFIAEVAEMRRRQLKFDTEYGAINANNKHRQQDKVDSILYQMGITDETNLKDISIKFQSELLP